MAMYAKVNSLALKVVFVLLAFCFLCETVIRSKYGCIVCEKKSQNIPFRSSASYFYDLEACFGFNPIDVNAGDICDSHVQYTQTDTVRNYKFTIRTVW